MMPVSKVDSSNYDLLGNQLVGESHAVRMRRARQDRNHVPTLGITTGAAGRIFNDTFSGDPLSALRVGARPGTTVYSIVAGLGAGGLVGLLAPRYGSLDSSQTALAAVLTGGLVAAAGPFAVGNPYAQALSNTEQTTLVLAGAIGTGYLAWQNWDVITDSVGDAMNLTTVGVLGLVGLAAIGAFADSAPTISKWTVWGLPVLIAMAAAGFAHGAVRSG
jgi:uncharacterized membrane protein YuzA (DUF378 family)